MKNYKMAEVLANLPDDLLLEAADVQKKPRGKWLRRIVAAAAALAILVGCWLFWPVDEETYVTAPGLLVVRAYGEEDDGLDPPEGVVLEEGVTFAKKATWSVMSNWPGMLICFSIPEDAYVGEEINFEITLSAGALTLNRVFFDENGKLLSPYVNDKLSYLGNQYTVSNDGMIYFLPYTVSFDDATQERNRTYFEGQKVFGEIVIYAGKHIIGYAVIEFNNLATEWHKEISGHYWDKYGAKMLEARSFPLLDGRFQNVKRGHVQEQFERIKAESGNV